MDIKSTVVMSSMVIFFSLMIIKGEGQNTVCMNQLLPCTDYMNSNRDPPDSCCAPLKYIIENEPECLCSMMTVKGANKAEQAGVDLSQAQTLPARCGQRINPLGCVVGSPTESAASSMSTSKIAAVVSFVILQLIWKLFVMI